MSLVKLNHDKFIPLLLVDYLNLLLSLLPSPSIPSLLSSESFNVTRQSTIALIFGSLPTYPCARLWEEMLLCPERHGLEA